MVVLDRAVFLGSSNLDIRSLGINYELMLRLRDPQLICDANALFNEMRCNSKQITLEEWQKSRSFIQKLKERWAYFLLARLDPYLMKRQMKYLR